jgi:DNA helicase IV
MVFRWFKRIWGKLYGSTIDEHLYMMRKINSAAPEHPFNYTLQGVAPVAHRRISPLTAGPVLRQIDLAFAALDLNRADQSYELIRHWYSPTLYARWRTRWCQYHQAVALAQIEALLAAYAFAQADTVAARYQVVLSADEYLRRKANAVQEYFEQRYKMPLNDEQVAAIINPAWNLLVTARAGSGKTRTIVCKSAFEIEHASLYPDQILLLAFNRKAAQEMLKRLRTEFGFAHFATARTFHSLAFQLVKPVKSIVAEEGDRARLLMQAIQAAMTRTFWRVLKHFLMAGDDPDLSAEATMNDADYLTYRRSLNYTSLSGVAVKSTGEKWIADFLFEHGIWFTYEKTYVDGGYPYRPDFTLRDEDEKAVIIEHWGVSATTEDHEPIFGGSTTAGQYRRDMAQKRRYWAQQGIPLLETSVDDMQAGRKVFEAKLAERLAAVGIVAVQLPEEELQVRLERIHLSRLSQQVGQFVQRAKNLQLSPADVRQRLGRFPKTERRTRLFWMLATRVYLAYEATLAATNQIDFHDLMLEAAQVVEATQGRCSFQVRQPERQVRLDQLRWLLIDEFQDFAPAFDRLVQAMRRYNPDLRLYCVGDDWQAINAFAGSDLLYFHSFAQNVAGAAAVSLQTNQRSERAIVAVGNQLMRDHGLPARWRADNTGGSVQFVCLDQLRMEVFRGEAADARFRLPSGKYDDGFMTSRCLKFCWWLIAQPQHQQKRVAILSRTNQIYNSDLLEFKVALLNQLGEAYEPWVDVSTVHSYKGLEADLVILAGAVEGTFPLIHADNRLFAPFLAPGVDPREVALADERRLFYVALTRAKEKLWILTETGRMSPFLAELDLPEMAVPEMIVPEMTMTA